MSQEVPQSFDIDTKVKNLFKVFDEMCDDRLDLGAQRYGNFNFLHADTLTMALEELADLANYAKMTFARIVLLGEQIAERAEEGLASEPQGSGLGGSFRSGSIS